MSSFFEWRDAPEGDFAVLGDPIAHSSSPQMHEAAFRALDLPYSYHRIRVPGGELDEALAKLAARGYRGVNVTIPLKGEAANWASGLDDLSRQCGAVNTLRLESGEGINTDAPGFMDTLAGAGLEGREAVLLGAGGAARAVALALHRGGYNLRVFNRTRERADALLRELGLPGSVIDEPTAEGADLIVNATSASLTDLRLPILWAGARPSALAYDLAYGRSAFVDEARSHGLRAMDGAEMLVAQGARSFEFWLGLTAPRDLMREALGR